MSGEEYNAHIDKHYHVDSDTREILGPKLRFSQIAFKKGVDWNASKNVWDYANELYDVMQAQSNAHGR